MSALLERLQAHPKSWPFLRPVDHEKLGLTDYLKVVKEPMDLGTVAERLVSQSYAAQSAGQSDRGWDAFRRDVLLVFKNAMAYNQEGSEIHDWARQLKASFEAGCQGATPKSEQPAPVTKASREETVEVQRALPELLAQLPVDTHVRHFAALPEGWKVQSSRGGVQRYHNEELDVSIDGRVRFEKWREEDHDQGWGSGAAPPWLGSVVNGVWEIRPGFLLPAVCWILRGLEASGQLSINAEGDITLLVNNLYIAGAAFAAPPRTVKRKVDQDENGHYEAVPVSEYERHRLDNVSRNQAFLQSLGLQ